jgi:putative NIF3 family GTP cyclohydrolase 1 type 2
MIMSVLLKDLVAACDTLLQSQRFKDYCPNGLQVEGAARVSRVALAVTANQAAIDAALAWGAQALLVHHGLMWKGEDGTLPLDAHPELGNNAQLAQKLGFTNVCALADEGVLMQGVPQAPCTAAELGSHISAQLARPVQVIGDNSKSIRTLAWCTGGGGSYFERAIAAGVDAFLTGEASEQHVHIARECSVPLLLAGHHATERYGVQALGAALAAQLGVTVRYFEVDSPL